MTLWVDAVVTVTVVGDSDSVLKVLPTVLPAIVDELSLCVDDGSEKVSVGLLVLVIVDAAAVEDWFGI